MTACHPVSHAPQRDTPPARMDRAGGMPRAGQPGKRSLAPRGRELRRRAPGVQRVPGARRVPGGSVPAAGDVTDLRHVGGTDATRDTEGRQGSRPRDAAGCPARHEGTVCGPPVPLRGVPPGQRERRARAARKRRGLGSSTPARSRPVEFRGNSKRRSRGPRAPSHRRRTLHCRRLPAPRSLPPPRSPRSRGPPAPSRAPRVAPCRFQLARRPLGHHPSAYATQAARNLRLPGERACPCVMTLLAGKTRQCPA